jgi:hypothetical protein
MTAKKANPTWIDIKAQLAEVDRTDLLGLVQALYAASKDNQAFLHARLQLGDDVFKPHKATIARWLWPSARLRQDTSVAKAKKAIEDYKKASGTADGLAELMVFYCEQAAGFSREMGLDDEAYFAALVRMFGQALKSITALLPKQRAALRVRLDAVRAASKNFGYGVADDLDELLAEHGGND